MKKHYKIKMMVKSIITLDIVAQNRNDAKDDAYKILNSNLGLFLDNSKSPELVIIQCSEIDPPEGLEEEEDEQEK
jgi:hypothetical protein